MANLKLEGNLANISEVQKNYVLKVLQERGYKDKTVMFSSLSKTGDNYMANVRKIIVENDDGTKFKMIAKLSVQDPTTRNMMGTGIAFSNESYMYTKVFPKFSEMEIAANIPENKRFQFAKCYGVCIEEPYEVILLEDLTESEYQVLDKFVPFGDDNVRLVLSNLAHYHALAFAWKIEDIESFDALKGKLRHTRYNFSEKSFKEIFEPIEKQILEWDVDHKYFFKRGLLVGLWQDFKTQIERDKHSEFLVILHGDIWTNNIVFKSKESITSCILIDYQMVIQGKPAADLLLFLFTSTIHEQRVIHFEDWIQYYYESLDTFLNYFGLTAYNVLPREQLNAHIKEYADISAKTSFFTIFLTLREASESIEILNEEKNGNGTPVNNVDLLDVTPMTKKRLQERATGIAKTLKHFNLV